MKKQYIQPLAEVISQQPSVLLAGSNTITVQGEYSDANEEDSGGAGVLSRSAGLWYDSE